MFPFRIPTVGIVLYFVLVGTLLLSLCNVGVLGNDNLDRFTYGETIGNTYGPKDWAKIRCPDPDVCLGWADTMPNSQGWEIDSTNHCLNCPAEGNGCGVHHNSPINVQRNRAIVDDPEYNMCIDGHWISYYDSSCSFDDLRTKNGFVINRHALTIKQPMSTQLEPDSNTLYAIDCASNGRKVWGKMDFPKGFSDWWLLSHIDFKVPSEHTQEGKRYHGEIQLFHYYEVSGDVAGVNNEMGTVSIFLEVYDNTPEWPELNRIICAWREAEDNTRKACGLPSVSTQYTGCPVYGNVRGRNLKRESLRRSDRNETTLRTTTTTTKAGGNTRNEPDRTINDTPATSAYDIIMDNLYHKSIGNASYQPKMINLKGHVSEPDPHFDWDEFIKEQNTIEYERQQRLNTTRHLQDSGESWFNYFPMLKVKTEYYFRYSGTQTSPPCYGDYMANSNRKQTNHWRVMKDPIRIAQRQLLEMNRLIKDRIAPSGSLVNSCQPDTASIPDPVDPNNRVMVSRPLQSTHSAHFEVFCECTNWKSKFIEDVLWCKRYKNDQHGRFYEHPYNFDSNGF